MLSLSTIFSFLAGISLIAAIHELGHLLVAKLFGMRVKRYMVFFPPKLFGIVWGGTEYGVGTIPLGGFVEIQGMGEKKPAGGAKALSRGDFRGKPAWQRALVMLGGILFNLCSAYLIFFCLFMTIGGSYLAKDVVNEHGIAPTALGEKIGLVRGDRVIGVNGHDFVRFSELHKATLSDGPPLTYTVVREGEKQEISVPNEVKQQLLAQGEVLCHPLVPFSVKRIIPGGGAARAGLVCEDRIMAVNGQETPYWQDLQVVLLACKGSKVLITVVRGGQKEDLEVSVSEDGKIGIEIENELSFTKVRYGLAEALIKSGYRVGSIAQLQIKGIIKIAKREVAFRDSLQSPVGIASLFGQCEGFAGFLLLIAILSIILALMNLLPIPALDGFHFLLAIGEMVTGRAVPHKWYVRMQQVGALFLILLTLFLVLNDLSKIFGNTR